MLRKPSLPTYETIAKVMSDEHGSGLALAAWTIGRAALILPALGFVGVPFDQAVAGSVTASTTISTLALFRFHAVAQDDGHRKDFPVKALLWLGGITVAVLAVYHMKKKEEPAPPQVTVPQPINPADVSEGLVPPVAPLAPLGPPDQWNINPEARRAPITGLGRLRISRFPF